MTLSIQNIKKYIRYNPTPIGINTSYMQSFGSVLLGIILAMQLVTGSFLAIHYFSLVQYFLIGRDVSEAAGKAIINGKEVYYVKFPES